MTRKKIGPAPPKQPKPRKPLKGRPAGKKSGNEKPQGAKLQRSGQDHRPAGLDYTPDSYRDCLQVPTDQIDKDASAMAEIAGELPYTAFSAEEDGDAARLPPEQDASLDVLVRNTANGLRLSAAVGIDLGVKNRPEDLAELVEQDVSCRGINLLANRIADSGMDRRAITGGFGWFLLDRTLTYLQHQVAVLPRTDRERLLGDFLNPLTLIDKEMHYETDRKAQLSGDRTQMGQEAQAAEDDAQALLTRQEWKAGQQVSRAALLSAARHLKAKQDQQGTEGRKAPR